MARPTRKLPRIAALLAVVAVAGAFWAASRSPRPEEVRPAPGLKSARIVGWLDGRRVVALPYGSHQQLEGLDLETGKKLYLKGLDSDNVPWPFPSPDGRWLLYVEFHTRLGRSSRHTRFRLASNQDGASRYIPSSGRFDLEAGYPCWLPDSQGWIAIHDDARKNLRLTRYEIDALDSPRPVPVAPDFAFPGGEARVTTTGELAIGDRSLRNRLHFLPLDGSKIVRSVTLDLPARTLPWARDYGGNPPPLYALFPDGRSALVCVEIPDGPFQAWLHHLLKRSQVRWEFQRIPVNGDPPEPLLSVDQKVGVYYLADDGKSVVYRTMGQKKDGEEDYLRGPAFWRKLP